MEGDEDAPFSRSFWQDRYFHILVPTYWLKRGVCMSPTPDGSEDQQGMPLCSIPDSLVAPWLERRTQLCVGVAHAHAEGDGHHVGNLLSTVSGETLLCIVITAFP